MRIAIAQINVTVGDFIGNQNKILDFINQARANHCDLVVFPELVLCGYPPEDLLYKEHFVRDNLHALQLLIKKTKNITAIIGCVDQDKKILYNAAAVIENGQLKGISHKEDLPNYGVFDEKRYFSPGKNKQLLFSLGKIPFAVNICEDIWRDDGLSVQQAKNGARLLINISSSPYYEGKAELRWQMLKRRARQTQSFICYANLIGGQDELVFDGTSMILDPQGKILAQAKQFREDLLIYDLDVSSLTTTKNSVKKLTKTIALAQNIKNQTTPKTHFYPTLALKEQVYQALVLGTRDYVRKNGFEKVVIGLSGGIDSALVALIACDAIGKENVVGISMPSRFSSAETQSDAKQLAQNLGIRFIEVPIDHVFNAYLSMLKEDFQGTHFNITEENLQARIRGNILMAFSNKFGWLVLTTGNKSEIAVGYCTLYGDMSGGFAVIKDVPKVKVYELAGFRNNQEQGAVLIPKSIFDRAPTAELRANQKDQDSLPLYETLDPILKSYVEEHRSFDYILKHNKNTEEVKKVIKLVDKSEYKRRQAPPGVKISPLAFGKDWRLPITNRYKEF